MKHSQNQNSLNKIQEQDACKENKQHLKWKLDNFETKEYIAKGILYKKYNFKQTRIHDKGKTGIVYKAIEKSSKEVIALKVIKKHSILQKQQQYLNLKREIEIQSRLVHKHIVRAFGYFHNEENVYQILEYSEEGNLFNYLRKTSIGFPEDIIARYAIQLITCLQYLHKRHIMHRDIKLENILLFDNQKTIKLADFGSSVHCINGMRKSLCGTEEYLAPQIVNKEFYDNSVDLWSFGILIYEMFFKQSPFKEQDIFKQFQKIKRGEFYFPDQKREISHSAKSFIKQILQTDPNQRITLEEMLQHQFIKPYLEQYKQEIQYQMENNNINQQQQEEEVQQYDIQTSYQANNRIQE